MAQTRPTSYDGFLSYSHAADDLLAPRLQAGLQRFAKPWWKRRALRVFRDEASLSANPHLWTSITDALDDSDWFVLLLSPEAAESEWVNREIDYWVEYKDAGRILPVVTDGTFGWSDGDVAGDAVPDSLRGVFGDEPRWVDLRFARTETQLDLRHVRFRDTIADIAAAIRGVPKDELASEEVRQHRRTIRTAWTAGVAILALGVAATVGAVVARNAQQEAEANAARAERNASLAEGRRLEAERAAESEAQAAAESEYQRAIAEQERQLAEAAEQEALRHAELAGARAAVAVLDDDPELALLLALTAAGDVEPLPETTAVLRSALQRHRIIRTITWPFRLDWSPEGSISPDGQRIAVSGGGSQMAVWDLADGSNEPAWQFDVPSSASPVIVPYFTTDGSHVIAAVGLPLLFDLVEWFEPPSELGIYVLDTQTGEVIRHIPTPGCPIHRLAQSGRFLDETRPVAAITHSTGNCSPDWATDSQKDLWMIDLASGEVTLAATLPTSNTAGDLSVSTDADNSYAAVGNPSGQRVVNLRTGETSFEVDGWQLRFTGDGSQLLTTGPQGVVLRDITTETQRWRNSTLAPSDLWFGMDEKLVYGSTSDSIPVWDAANGDLIWELRHPGVKSISMTEDGTRIASISSDGTVKIWDLAAGPEGEIAAFDLPGVVLARSGTKVGDRLAVLLDSGQTPASTATITDLTSGNITHEFHEYGGYALRISPDGSLLSGQSFTAPGTVGPVQIRDISSGQVLVELENWCSFDHETYEPGADCVSNPDAVGGWVWSLDFSPDGTMLAVTAEGNSSVGVWSVETGKMVTRLTTNPQTDSHAESPAIRFSPSSDLQAVASSELHVLETTTWTAVAHSFLPFPANDLRFTPDGQQLISVGYSGIINLDTTTWSRIAETSVDNPGMLEIAISPDGLLLATALLDFTDSNESSVHVWDTQTLELHQTIPLVGSRPAVVEFTKDRRLLIVPHRGPVRVVTTHILELIDIARSRLTRGFTADECATYHIDPCPDLETIRNG